MKPNTNPKVSQRMENVQALVEKLQEHCNAEGLEVIDEGGKLIVPDKFATDSSEALNSFMDM